MKTSLSTLFAAALIVCSAGAQAKTVTVNPGVVNTVVGGTFSVSLDATSFADLIVGGGYDLSFDPSILKLDKVTFAAAWDKNASKAVINNATGKVKDLFFNNLVTSATGNFGTATFEFRALAAGTSALNVEGSPDMVFANEAAEVVSVNFVDGTVNVVPEPTSTAMALAGLAMAALAVRRRRG